jgi:hypothetical protein
MSFDINKSIQKGERDAKAEQRAKRRGAAAGRGGRSGSSGFSRSAGRAAVGKMQIRGRGITIESWENGKSFSHRVHYAEKEAKGAQPIFANSDLRSMKAAAKLRPKIKEPVGHISMSLPPSVGKYTKEQWLELLETTRDQLGLEDTFPLIASRHQDTRCDHIHIVFSRISVTGKVHDQANIGLRCAAVERILEDKHSLKLVPPNEFKTHGHTTKGEIEKAIRTHQRPARLLITDALKVAIQGKPTVEQFVERLQAAGVGVKANVASTGKMNGFSFIFDGIAFSGSNVSREFGWSKLSGVINYDEVRDSEFLRQLDGGTGTAGNDVATANSIVDALDRAVERVNPPALEPAGYSSSPAAVTRPASKTVERSAPPKPASHAAATPRGFARAAILDSSLRGWAGALHNRIVRARVLADHKQQQRALYDSRDRIAAISDAAGIAIPEPRHLSDEQIVSLIEDLGGAQDKVEIKGSPEFCERVEQVAQAHGLKVTHEYQISAEERAAAEKRWEERQCEELAQGNANSNLPTFSPK